MADDSSALLTQAQRLVAVLMARGDRKLFGDVRRTSDGKRWRIDARPYGWISSLAGVPFGDDRGMAEAVLNVIRVKIATGVPKDDAVGEFLPLTADTQQIQTRYTAWLEHMQALVEIGDRSPTTVREYRRYAREGGELSWWGAESLAEVSEGTLDDWSLWMARERKLAPKTRRHVLGAFRAFLGWCRRKRYLRELPDFPEVKVPDYEPTILSSDAQQAVLDAIPEPDQGIYLVCALMGLRPSEARALTVADYRAGEPPRITVAKAMRGGSPNAPVGPTKTRRNRVLPAPEPVVAWIDAHWPAERRLEADPGASLFTNPRTRRRWSHWAFWSAWRKACTAAGLPRPVKPYEGTKHSFATEALERTKSERAVRDYLGHADVRSTARYARRLDGGMLEIARRRGRG